MLAGKRVRFRLLPSGREAVETIVPAAEFLDGFVVDENHMGVWIWVPKSKPVRAVLLKWEHFSTATVEYEPQAPERAPAGFRR
jgi:hypothetical protein